MFRSTPVLASLHAIATRTYESWRADRTIRLGAGLAYYALFAIVPILAVTAALSEWLFGTEDMQVYLAERFNQLGLVDAEATGDAIGEELSRRSVQSSLGLIGLGSLIFAASIVFIALTDAINTIWDMPVRTGMRNWVRRRLVSFVMVLASGAVIIGGFAVTAVTGAAEAFFPNDPEFLAGMADLMAVLASGVSLAVLLILLFRFLSPVTVPWRVAITTGVLTAGMLVVGTTGISWYLSNLGGASVTGALGAVLLILTWIYYEAQILLGGVQLTKVLVSADWSHGFPVVEPDEQ